ncbi:hypothetical protein MMC25_000372 [Agyrium rufum]|nr:hypothetical protein [Agyrium rufum]
MTSPVSERSPLRFPPVLEESGNSTEDNTFVEDENLEDKEYREFAPLNTNNSKQPFYRNEFSPSQGRDVHDQQFQDDLHMLRIERITSEGTAAGASQLHRSLSIHRSRSRRTDPADQFDVNTNPIHEKMSGYQPPEHPSTEFAKFFKKVHNSSFLIRYFTYIVPLVIILLIPLLLGSLLFKNATVGGVELMWFSIWLEIVWLTLWAGRIVAKMVPWPLGLVASLFTNNSKKWRDMGKQLEVPATLFFWGLAVEISFLPTMRSHHARGVGNQKWEDTVNKILVSILVGVTLNFIEKIIIQLIAISFHLRTYADRIELNKFQISSLVKLYQYSKEKIHMADSDFEEHDASGGASGTRTPMQLMNQAQKNVTEAFTKVGDVAGKVAGDFTGRAVTKSTHPHQVVLLLLNTTQGGQVLARRLYRTFLRSDDTETVNSDDLKAAFENEEEAEAAFSMFDKDLNGDISMEELEQVCVEIGRERKSITASLKDLDSVVSKLNAVLLFVVIVVTSLVFITLISSSAAGVLTSAGSAVLALSWLFSATAQEFLQSVIFVFVKHPFDVGDRVHVYGNSGALMRGDDYFVKEISLLYTEFKKMEGHVVQAPNSYLNTLFIMNMRRSGGLAEAVPLTVKFGTTLDQIEELRDRLLVFVKEEKREYQANVITEITDLPENFKMTLNVVFFYKSNWQNELLRLQRRNKFICALICAMEEIGIEGPNMRIPGAKPATPYYVQHNGPYPDSSNNQTLQQRQQVSAQQEMDSPDPSFVAPAATSGFQSQQQQNQPNRQGSVLRRGPSVTSRTTAGGSSVVRNRGESVTSMARRVDFSLGMKDISSGNLTGDVYDSSPTMGRIPDIRKMSPSRSRSVRKAIPEEKEPEDENDGNYFNGARTGSKLGRSNTRISKNDGEGSKSRFTLHRAATDNQNGGNGGGGGSKVHRNRFFGRRGARERAEVESEYQDLMEQGMADVPDGGRMDPRSGIVSPRAVRTESEDEDGEENKETGAAGGGLPRWEDRRRDRAGTVGTMGTTGTAGTGSGIQGPGEEVEMRRLV